LAGGNILRRIIELIIYEKYLNPHFEFEYLQSGPNILSNVVTG
jgi:hypothetical protein